MLSLKPVQSVGSRFGIVSLFVTRTLSEKEQDKIKQLLVNKNILIYDVIQVKYNDLMGTCTIGSRIGTDSIYGTLGCFAIRRYKDIKNDICALLSGHVVKMLKGCDINISGNNVKKKDIHFMTCKSGRHNADIAALLFNKDLLKQFSIDCKFKTKHNVPKTFEMPNWDSKTFEVPFDVYFRGATTPVGLGSVSATDMTQYGGEDCILVEKIDEDSPFCKPGDSGAVVCFDETNVDEAKHTIKTLAIVQGLYTSKDEDLEGFLCVKLDFALEQLAFDFDGTLRICDEFSHPG